MQVLRKGLVGYFGRAVSAVAALLLIAGGDAFAYELETTISAVEEPDATSPTYGLEMTYFFRPVIHGGGAPREELPWMERISTLSVGSSYERDRFRAFEVEELGAGFVLEWDFEAKSKTRGLEAEYIYREPDSPHALTVNGGYYKNKTNLRGTVFEYSGNTLVFEESFDFDVSTDGFAVGFGYDYYLADFWTAGAEVGYAELDSFDESVDLKSMAFRTQRLWRLAGRSWAGLGLIATYARADSDTKGWGFEVEGKFYFNERTGLHVSFEEDDIWSAQFLEGGITHYVTDSVFVRLKGSQRRLDASIAGEDRTSTGWGIMVGSRF